MGTVYVYICCLGVPGLKSAATGIPIAKASLGPVWSFVFLPFCLEFIEGSVAGLFNGNSVPVAEVWPCQYSLHNVKT